MPSDDNEICFRGDSGVECKEFIQQVRLQARKEGRTQDGAWIADFASTCIRGKALRWYIHRSLETRRDWELLRVALSERWPFEDDETKSTPAAAAPSFTAPSTNDKIGRLKVQVSGNDTAHWVSVETQSNPPELRKGALTLTRDPQKALNVQIIPLEDQVWRLKMLNHPSGYDFVAMYILGPSIKKYFGILIGANVLQGTSLREHRSTYYGTKGEFEFKTDVWKLDEKGQALSISPKAASGSGGSIYLKKSEDTILIDDTPPQCYPGMEIHFEPLNG